MSTTPPRFVDPAAVRRVLFIRPRFLGDVCLTLPAVEAVRRQCPEAELGYVVEPEAAPLLSADPRFALRLVAHRRGAHAWIRVVRGIQAFQPDIVFDLFCNPRTALWTRLSGASVRVGTAGKGWRSACYTHRVRSRTLSAVEFHLASVAALGWPAPMSTPRLHVGAGAREEARAALLAAGASPAGPWVGFHPGARWPTRRWAPERFAALAGRFLDAIPDGCALITGGPGDEARIAEIGGRLPTGRWIPVLGWPIERLVGVQSLCAAFVSGDSGPLHTAVAAGTPTLALMSRNSPAMFFPYPEGEGHRAYYARVECSPCHRDLCADLRCLERLTVEGAWTRLAAMLARGREVAA